MEASSFHPSPSDLASPTPFSSKIGGRFPPPPTDKAPSPPTEGKIAGKAVLIFEDYNPGISTVSGSASSSQIIGNEGGQSLRFAAAFTKVAKQGVASASEDRSKPRLGAHRSSLRPASPPPSLSKIGGKFPPPPTDKAPPPPQGALSLSSESVPAHRVVVLETLRAQAGSNIERIEADESLHSMGNSVDLPRVEVTAEKVDQAVEKPLLEYQYITQGKAKMVYFNKRNAIYVPVGGVGTKTYKSKLQELKDEKMTADAIKTRLTGNEYYKNALKYIQADLELPEENTAPDNKYGLTAEKADGDLEKTILKPDLAIEQRLDMAFQSVYAMAAMHHGAKMVHRDLKPDNFLYINNGNRIKLSDFGKTTGVDADKDEIKFHTGNPRYSAPEGVASTKAEVYSTALIIIRILEEDVLTSPSSAEKRSSEGARPDSVGSEKENISLRSRSNSSIEESDSDDEEFLDVEKEVTSLFDSPSSSPISSLQSKSPEEGTGDMIMTSEHFNPARSPSSKRRGIEKFLILNDLTPQRESEVRSENIKMRSSMLLKFLGMGSKRKTTASPGQDEVQKYLSRVMEKLTTKYQNQPETLVKLAAMDSQLKKMLLDNPGARPSMEEAYKALTKDFGVLHQEGKV